jgi:hypothetical protein
MMDYGIEVGDIANVLSSRPAKRGHPSPKKRAQTGYGLDGRKLKVVYREPKKGQFRVVTVMVS